jgi:urease accessory protein
MTGALLLLLLDSRSPSGGHNHSMGMESAVGVGLVRTFDDVVDFCRGRLLTSGRLAGAFSAAACAAPLAWPSLDAEFAARTPSEAMRTASRALGRGVQRLAAAMLPGVELPAAHHPIVLGAAVRAAGGTPEQAAGAAALSTVTVPASAAVRLLGLDPFGVQAMLADLAREIDAMPPPVSTRPASLRDLPADSAPFLDLLADHHLTTEVRLFAS